jgi:hypothetical protein
VDRAGVRRSAAAEGLEIELLKFWAVPTRLSSQMRCSLIDGQYSPSIGMDRREWEIVLGEYKCMGFL